MDLKSAFFGQGGGVTKLTALTGVGELVSLFVKISFVIAGLILLFFFVMGGIGMIGNAGQNDPQKMEQGKKTATSAIIGFVIVFASYWIVKLIGQILKFPLL